MNKMKPYITLEDAIAEQSQRSGYKLLTEENGCTAGCCSGVSIYADTEFNTRPGAHEDQEGFFVLDGEGYAKLDDLVFEIKSGDSFVAAPGVRHTIKSKYENQPVKVFWFHSAI